MSDMDPKSEANLYRKQYGNLSQIFSSSTKFDRIVQVYAKSLQIAPEEDLLHSLGDGHISQADFDCVAEKRASYAR